MLKNVNLYSIILKIKGGRTIGKVELAVNIINLKIAKEVKYNKETQYSIFKEKITNLENERNEIYLGNEEKINEILTKYLDDIKE